VGAQGVSKNVKNKSLFSNKIVIQGKIHLLLPDSAIHLVDLHLTTLFKGERKLSGNFLSQWPE